MTATFLRYDRIKRLAAELRRPASTLIALAPANDPFSITPGRRGEGDADIVLLDGLINRR